jgi:hypothetical protein
VSPYLHRAGSWTGPGLVSFRYSKSDHGGYGGAEIGQLKGGKIVLSGGGADDRPVGRRPDLTIDRDPRDTAGERDSDAVGATRPAPRAPQ